ncbi:hypothetical protein UB43_01480 [Pseudomonas sp. 21]|nr:hypothetical protein UB43_01480 [Pseudomonas sp. 21]
MKWVSPLRHAPDRGRSPLLRRCEDLGRSGLRPRSTHRRLRLSCRRGGSATTPESGSAPRACSRGT